MFRGLSDWANVLGNSVLAIGFENIEGHLEDI